MDNLIFILRIIGFVLLVGTIFFGILSIHLEKRVQRKKEELLKQIHENEKVFIKGHNEVMKALDNLDSTVKRLGQ